MSRIMVVSLTTVVLTLACTQPAPQPAQPDAAQMQAASAGFWRRWSDHLVAGQVDSIGSLVTENVHLDATGFATIDGREAFLNVLREAIKTAKLTGLAFEPATRWADGDHVYEQGTFQESLIPAGQPPAIEYVRYMCMFEKDSAGGWRLARWVSITDSMVSQKPPPR